MSATKAAGGQARPNLVELVPAHRFASAPHNDRSRFLANVYRGVWSLEMRYRQAIESLGPAQMIAEYRSFAKLTDRFAERHDLCEDALARELALRRSKSEVTLVLLDQPAKTVRRFRGDRLVRVEEIARGQIAGLARRMGEWMIRNLHGDGRKTYKYWPSRGRESEANNMIRQWMAAPFLVHLARLRGAPQLAELAACCARPSMAMRSASTTCSTT